MHWRRCMFVEHKPLQVSEFRSITLEEADRIIGHKGQAGSAAAGGVVNHTTRRLESRRWAMSTHLGEAGQKAHSLTCTCRRTRTLAHTHAHTHTYIYTYTHARARTNAFECRHTHAQSTLRECVPCAAGLGVVWKVLLCGQGPKCRGAIRSAAESKLSFDPTFMFNLKQLLGGRCMEVGGRTEHLHGRVDSGPAPASLASCTHPALRSAAARPCQARLACPNTSLRTARLFRFRVEGQGLE